MSFPFDTDDIYPEEEKEPCEYGIDFETGQLTGKKVYGLEALKVWIWMALKTPRYRHIIYTWDHGHEIEELIGKSHTQEYIKTELPRMISDCLSMNKHITGISDCDFLISGDKVTGSFTVKTTYGEARINV